MEKLRHKTEIHSDAVEVEEDRKKKEIKIFPIKLRKKKRQMKVSLIFTLGNNLNASDFRLQTFGDKKLVKHTGSNLCFFSVILSDSRQVADGKVQSEPIGPSSFSTELSLINLMSLSNKEIRKPSVRSADY